MTQRYDLLVEEYLAAVAGAGSDLPSDRRDELLADLREHIASARADLAPETEAGVRTILARLGDPASIVAEVRLGVKAQPLTPAVPVLARRRRGTPGWVIALIVVGVVVFLTCAGILVGLVATRSGPTKPIQAPTSLVAPSGSPAGVP